MPSTDQDLHPLLQCFVQFFDRFGWILAAVLCLFVSIVLPAILVNLKRLEAQIDQLAHDTFFDVNVTCMKEMCM